MSPGERKHLASKKELQCFPSGGRQAPTDGRTTETSGNTAEICIIKWEMKEMRIVIASWFELSTVRFWKAIDGFLRKTREEKRKAAYFWWNTSCHRDYCYYFLFFVKTHHNIILIFKQGGNNNNKLASFNNFKVNCIY